MADTKIIHVDSVTRKVSFRLSSKIIEGIEELIQVVILSLLNVPGKDVLDPADGGGIPAMIGANFSLDDPQEIYAEVQQRVSKTRSEILLYQIGLDLPDTAKLSNLGVLSIDPGANLDEVLVRLRLVNEAGEIADVVV